MSSWSVILRHAGAGSRLLRVWGGPEDAARPAKKRGEMYGASIKITDLQRRILQEMLSGATDDVIARRLYMSERAVRQQIAHVADLVGARGRFALGVEAARRGLLERAVAGR